MKFTRDSDGNFKIIIEPEATDPKLNPKSPDFDIEAWREAVLDSIINGKTQEQVQEALDKLRQTLTALEEAEKLTERKKSDADKRNKAIEQGALMTIGNRIASYSAKGYENALNIPAIFKLPSGQLDRANLFNTRGKLNTFAFENGEHLEGLTKLHKAFLMALNQIAIESATDINEDNGGLMRVYLPTFCREIGLDPRKYSDKREGAAEVPLSRQRAAAVTELLEPFESYVGRTPDGAYWRLATFHGYDPESDTMTISAPYLYELRKAEALQGRVLNQLMHSSAVNEPNWAAVELANRILDGLLRRGSRPDNRTYTNTPRKTKETHFVSNPDGSKERKVIEYDVEQMPPIEKNPKVTWRLSFKSLIKDCPQFSRELEDILAGRYVNPHTGQPTTSKPAVAYNSKLRHTFETAIKIIMQKSDAPAYFIDLDIEPKNPKTGKFMPPTKTALNRNLIITHKGKNKDFQSFKR